MTTVIVAGAFGLLLAVVAALVAANAVQRQTIAAQDKRIQGLTAALKDSERGVSLVRGAAARFEATLAQCEAAQV